MGVIAWVRLTHPDAGFQTWFIAGDHDQSVDWVQDHPENAYVYDTREEALAALEATTDWADEFPHDIGVSPA